MAGHEFRVRYAIAVGKDQVLGRCFRNGAIEDAAFAKAEVFLPDVADIQIPFLARPFDTLARLVSGTVIGDDDLEARIGLPRVAGKNAFEILGTVVGGEHHARGWCGAALERGRFGGSHAADFASRVFQFCEGFV